MNCSVVTIRQIARAGFFAGAALWSVASFAADEQGDKSPAQQIFETMIQVPGANAAFRTAHAKGIVCKGTFTPSKEAASLSKAAHFKGDAIPITVRFSDASQDPLVADNAAQPRGMAIRFAMAGGAATDIVSLSHNGFIVGTPGDFLALQKAIVATDPGKPHPWPIESFIGSHPSAAKFVQEIAILPVSFATDAFFSNDAFIFVNEKGLKQAGRYKFFPVGGQQSLSETDAKAKAPNYLFEELKARLSNGPVAYRMVVQLANAGDATNDPSLVWPDDRKTIEVGTISITAVAPDSDAAQKTLVFFPTNLTDGIELSDDPFPALRTSVYALSFARRQSPQ